MPITINGSGTITGASTLATPVASPTLTTPNINSAQFATVSGTAPIYPCRAWVNFNGTGTVAIRASGNVTSITDNGTGDYTVNFTTAMPDANYSASGLVKEYNDTTNSFLALNFAKQTVANTFSTTSLRVQSLATNGAGVDAAVVTVNVFR
jgi:hypothetical protein